MKGRSLRRIRRKLDLTQAALARELEVDVMTISRWERDVRPIPRTVELAVRYLEQRKGGQRP